MTNYLPKLQLENREPRKQIMNTNRECNVGQGRARKGYQDGARTRHRMLLGPGTGLKDVVSCPFYNQILLF